KNGAGRAAFGSTPRVWSSDEADKPDFVRRLRAGTFISLYVRRSGPARPWPLARDWPDATNPGLSDGPPSPLFSLAPDWVFRAAVVAFGAVGSYPTFSPLPRGCPRGGIFSVTLSVRSP